RTVRLCLGAVDGEPQAGICRHRSMASKARSSSPTTGWRKCLVPVRWSRTVSFIVIKKHRQFHIGVGGTTAPLEFMRQPTAALGVAVICVLVAGCGSTKGRAGSTTTTRSMIPRPLVERELTELLLSPDQVNVAMGATAMTVTNAQTSLSDSSATMAPQECLAIDGAAEAPDYVDSGFSAERDQSLNDGDNFKHYLKQAVVL